MGLSVALLALGLLAGCDLPRDPERTLERVEGGTLRVGVTESAPWVRRGDGGPAGVEVELARRLAAELGAEIEWTWGAQHELFSALERFELDLAIGGFTEKDPWSQRVGVTRPYLVTGEHAHVMAVPPGENRWLMRVEEHLHGRRRQIEELAAAESAAEGAR